MKLLLILSVFTTFSRMTYHSQCEVQVDAPLSAVNQAVDKFIYDMQTDIRHLGEWAFKCTGEEGEADADRDAIGILYKETYYEPKTRYGYITIDVKVPALRTFKDIKISSWMRDTITDGVRHAGVDIDYSGSLLKMANGTFHVKPLNDNVTSLVLDLNVKFGFFFNLFVTRRVYRNVLEWRLQQIMNNIREYSEDGKCDCKYRVKAEIIRE